MKEDANGPFIRRIEELTALFSSGLSLAAILRRDRTLTGEDLDTLAQFAPVFEKVADREVSPLPADDSDDQPVPYSIPNGEK